MNENEYNSMLQTIADCIDAELETLSDSQYEALLANHTKWTVPAAISSSAISALKFIVSTLPKADLPEDARWGAYHVACNRLCARLRERGVPTGDWAWEAFMELLGVSRDKIDAEDAAEKLAAKSKRATE